MSVTLSDEPVNASGGHDRLDALNRVISSQSFSKAPRLSSFLSYIVERSLSGDVDSLTEQQIGIHVFKRTPGYNSSDDTIVRGTARSLRQRLATYYVTEGALDEIQIEIPKGAYVAQFHPRANAIELPAAEAITGISELPPVATAASPAQQERKSWPMYLGWAAAAIFATVAVLPVAHERWVRSHQLGAPLWNTLFNAERPTLIVPGDAGLNMYETLDKRVVDLHDYSQEDYRTDAAAKNADVATTLGGRFYTTMSDLGLVSRLMQLPQARETGHTQVRFARDLSASDVKDANLIMMGTQSYNPWAQLFQNGPTLRMSWDVGQDLFTVQNFAPKSGEQHEYKWTVKNGVQGGLTVISLTDNTQGQGRVLLVEGTTMAGVFAATDFLQNRELLEPILNQARRPDGSLRNFDVLLQSDFVREGVSNLHVLAAHVR